MSRKQKFKQIVAGVALVACGIISASVTGDSTAAVLLVPWGLYTTFTREKLVM